ncbi:MAG: hypothetical protein FWD61_03970 [Phycisphaerales bacterium]|nr:hypothetical protein [Phycisphaerales bacterium]
MTVVRTNQAKPLSQRLLEPLHVVSARQRLLAFLLTVFQFLVLAATAWLAIVLLQGFFRDLPPLLAIPLAIVAWLIVILAFIRFFLRNPLFHRRDLTAAARLIDVALPATQERISSAVELAQEPDSDLKGSPELIAILTRQAETDAQHLDPAAVVSGKSVLRWFLLLIPILLLWLLCFALYDTNMLLGLHRTLRPWSAAPPLPQATLTLEPGDVDLAQGDPLIIQLTVTLPPGIAPPDPADRARATLTRRIGEGELTTDMKPTGVGTFSTVIPSVDQPFTYHASSLGARSQTYTVTVQNRPAITNLTITYNYPKYTQWPPRTETFRNGQGGGGAIDALVGTKVTVTLDANQSLQSATLLIADNAPNPSSLTMTPPPEAGSQKPEVRSNANRYTTDFIITRSTTYRLHLVNANGLDNKSEPPRSITARIDKPPVITITSPSTTLQVRPDDFVPIAFTATDDFGLTRLDALLQIDDAPPSLQPIPLPKSPPHSSQPTNVTDRYILSVAEILRSAPPNASPKRIYYQLRATDNREGMGGEGKQSALSARQILEIDSSVAPLAQRQDAEALSSLTEAQKDASAKLKDAQQKLAALEKSATNKPLSEKEKQDLAAARQQISDAKEKLAKAAESTVSQSEREGDSHLQDAAEDAKNIAEHPLQNARDRTTDAQLASDQPDSRNRSLQQAQQDLTDARRQLDDLGRKLGNKARDLPLTQQLERLAQEERQIARTQAENPNDPTLDQRKRDLDKKIDQMIKEHPDLQKPAAEARKQQTGDLAKKISEHQQTAAENARNQQAAAAPQPPADLQKRTKQLGERINDAVKNHHPPTRPSDPENREADKIADEIKKQASPLTQSKSPQVRQSAQEAIQSADNAKRDAAQGKAQSAQQNDSRAADQLAQANKAAGTPPPNNNNNTPSPAAAKSAADSRQLAEQLSATAKQMRELQQQTQANAPALSQQAGQAADQLEQAAQEQQSAATAAEKNQPDSVAQSLAKSAKHLSQAQQAISPSAPGPTGGSPSATEDRHEVAKSVQAARSASSPQEKADRLEQAAQQLAGGGGGTPTIALPHGASPQIANGVGQKSGEEKIENQKSKIENPPLPPPPQAAQDIGISPSDWARLSPAVQDQLLRAAQQPGPPEYYDMIKNYYTRIARLPQENL